MKKRLVVLLFVICLPSVQSWATDCATFNNSVLSIPCVNYDGINISLELIYDESFPYGFTYHNWGGATSNASCGTIDGNLNISVSCFEWGGRYSLYLTSKGSYWELTSITPLGDDTTNTKPIADSVSLEVDEAVPYIVQQLSARDPDNDVLIYELKSPSSGTGYTNAFINPNSGKLYVEHSPEGNDSFSLSYHVSDSMLWSDEATVSISVNYSSSDTNTTGQNEVDPEAYSEYPSSSLNSNIMGAVGDAPTTPRSIDLSANFPTPGDQGQQSSCVGWATAYALKSYQEKVEIGWALNSLEHLFSPAYLYNQINGGQDRGSYINEALQLVVDQGLSTLSAMPYDQNNYLTQPSQAAHEEASKFKAASWERANGEAQIKAALAKGNPVVVGIAVYDQLMQLSGANAVYNTSSGNNQGGHAVTIVGYDDDQYGGAYKIINSWGQGWGDGGYFWMPYAFAAGGVMSEAYILYDQENSEQIVPVEPTEPEPDQNTLPNLTVVNWDADYDPRPRGSGSLMYSVTNTGTGTAPVGVYVALVISPDTQFSSSDEIVVYEALPYDLATGDVVYRDQNSPISFMFPDHLVNGVYYMAVVVDPMDDVDETAETDNISPGEVPVTIQSTLPDLSVESWYAEWNAGGDGVLEYKVINSGSSSTTNKDWYVNLILDQDPYQGNGDVYFLFYETTDFILGPGEMIVRNENNPAYFNLYQTYDGYWVSSGIYYMALWVDDLDAEAESNELNNGSYGNSGPIQIGGYWGAQKSKDENGGQIGDDVDNGEFCENRRAYNGRQLPSASELQWRKVEITRSKDGNVRMKMVEENERLPQKMDTAQEVGRKTKTISAKNTIIFPTASRFAMP